MLPRAESYFVVLMTGAVAAGSAMRVGDVAEVILAAARFAPPPADVVTWIGRHAVPITTVLPGQGVADMTPLARIVGHARIVAVGEATHGTREFFLMKHRLLEYLVAELGFRVFAIEASQPECRAINAYVVDGRGDARTALAGIYFWTWNTEEVLALIEWMRAWNADPTHATPPVRFAGFDMQHTIVAHANLAVFVRRLAPDEAETGLAPIAVLGSGDARAKVGAMLETELTPHTEALDTLEAHFTINALAWRTKTSAKAFAEAAHDVSILRQATRLYSPNLSGAGFSTRDAAMAANIDWLLDQEPRGSRMMVWAHNGHIAKAMPSATNRGMQLAARHQGAYVALGFLWDHGSFQAIKLTPDADEAHRGKLDAFTLPAPASDGFASTAFVRAGLHLAVVDRREAPAAGAVGDWLHAPHLVRDLGSGFATEESATAAQVLPDLFDAVIFIEETTRARPVPRSAPREP